jgi:hypothetical protein
LKHSDSITNLATSLATAQGELEGAVKDSNNPAFSSKYADLSSVVAALKACFPKHGLSYSQCPCTNDKDEVGVETMLMHSSGEWLLGDAYFMPVAKANAHGFGSILTYARRYSLAAMAGVAPEDDDANAGVTAKLAGKMPPKEFVDHCTAMASATNADELRLAFTTAVRAAEKVGDEASKKSFTEKKDQLKSTMTPHLAEQA